jgi:hypothetical protein
MRESMEIYPRTAAERAMKLQEVLRRKAAKNAAMIAKVVSMSRLGGLHHRYDLAARARSQLNSEQNRG